MLPGDSQTLGKYQLVHHIATGGMADVFKAVYEVGGGIEKTCVVKRLLPSLANNPEFIDMFRDEARISIELTHANFVQVFDFGQEGEAHFLAMEYVRGQNLAYIQHRARKLKKRIPRDIAFFVISEVARGLHYAHTRKDDAGNLLGIVHRDVSPDNILVSYQGDVKLADFGIAKAANTSSKTQAGFIKGKASYVSPEQVMGGEVDARTDVFALGIVLWEMLTGRRLFDGSNELEIINKVCKERIPPPSEIVANLTYEFDDIVMTALQRNPDLRHPSAEAFRQALTALANKYNVSLTPEHLSQYVSVMFSEERQSELEIDRQVSKSREAGSKKNGKGGGGFFGFFRRKPKAQAKAAADSPAPSKESSAPKPASGSGPSPAPDSDSPSTRIFEPSAEELARDAGKPNLANLGAPPSAPTRDRVAEARDRSGPRPSRPRKPGRGRRRAFMLGVLLVLFAGFVAFNYSDLGVDLHTVPVLSALMADSSPTAAPSEAPSPTPRARRRRRRRARATPTPAPSVVASATPVAETTGTPRPDGAPATGFINIESEPPGRIFVDGKDIELSTPALDLEVPVGSYQIRVVNEAKGLAAQSNVTVVDGGHTSVYLSLIKVEGAKKEADAP